MAVSTATAQTLAVPHVKQRRAMNRENVWRPKVAWRAAIVRVARSTTSSRTAVWRRATARASIHSRAKHTVRGRRSSAVATRAHAPRVTGSVLRSSASTTFVPATSSCSTTSRRAN
jgi:hypothetical protein